MVFPTKKISLIPDTTCGANQFQCDAGDCIYSDNANCNGQCIQNSWVNDGEADCTDGSDEGEYSRGKSHVELWVTTFLPD